MRGPRYTVTSILRMLHRPMMQRLDSPPSYFMRLGQTVCRLTLGSFILECLKGLLQGILCNLDWALIAPCHMLIRPFLTLVRTTLTEFKSVCISKVPNDH